MQATVYPEINTFLEEFSKQITSILKDDFVGMYLYGSLALGDFDSDSSDLDILVATKRQLPEDKFLALKEMHAEIKQIGDKGDKKLEVSYMPLDVLKKYDPNNAKNPFMSSVSDFDIIELGKDWILNRWIVREKGITIAGPSPKDLIDPISKEDIKEAVKHILCNSWAKHMDGPEWMRPKKYQSFTILTMCRALYAMEYGEIISKPKAAEWAMKTLDEKWKPVIQNALLTRSDSSQSELNANTEALQFLSFVVSKYCHME